MLNEKFRLEDFGDVYTTTQIIVSDNFTIVDFEDACRLLNAQDKLIEQNRKDMTRLIMENQQLRALMDNYLKENMPDFERKNCRCIVEPNLVKDE